MFRDKFHKVIKRRRLFDDISYNALVGVRIRKLMKYVEKH